MNSKKNLSSLIVCLGNILDYVLPVVLFILVPLSLYYTFVIAPDEKIMGAVQRVLYFHVGSAFASYLMLGVLFVCSIFYFAFKEVKFFHISRAAGGVAFLFSTVVLVSGMLWGYSSWNTWWNWEPRLVSMLVLWVFLLSFLYIQNLNYSSEELKAGVSSVLGLLCALQVPLVVFSIKLLERTQQLHPEVVASGGLTVPEYRHAMIITSVTLLLFSAYICRLSYRFIAVNESSVLLKRKFLMRPQEK